MNKWDNMKQIIILVALIFSVSASAITWTTSDGAEVEIINPGGLGGKSTFFSLKGVIFSGVGSAENTECNRSDGAVILEDNKSYGEIFSILLAAKMSGKLVRVYYSGCSNPGGMPIATQAYIL